MDDAADREPAAGGGHTHKRRVAVALALAVCLVAAIAALATLGPTPPQEPARTTLADCERATSNAGKRACYTRTMLREVRAARDPTPVLARISAAVNRIGEFPAANCHVLMHTVGRRYADLHDVTLATLMEYLPQSNDAGCAAGFAHGMITAIAPEILRAGPAASEKTCARALTRFGRYSCTHGLGHAYMRFYAEALGPSLRLCRALGDNAAPDCAQGAYHDYWMAIQGSDETRRPARATTSARALCGRQPREFVSACWYRAFIESRPTGYRTRTAGDLTRICRDIRGIQRDGCITAASVIGSPNPLTQMRVCARLPDRDQSPCVRGVKVQNLIGSPAANQLRVIERCAWFQGRVATACYEWLGKVLEVISDGAFSREGCPRTARPQPCLRGARSADGPLVTFS
jgi:hypothetical protein